MFSSSAAAGIIEAQFPELAPVRIAFLGEGYDSWAFDVSACGPREESDRWVFRFPKRDDVERQLEIEMRLLPVLAGQSPVPVPAFRFHGAPSPAFPRRFGGYPMLPGVPGIRLDPADVPFERIAPEIGHFLSWLHAFPAAEAARAGVPEQPAGPLIREIADEALDDFDAVRTVAPEAPLDAWLAYLKRGYEIESSGAALSLVHADLAAEHILVDPATGTVTGVIDWSDMAVSDRALDFSGILHWGGVPFVKKVIAAYDGAIDHDLLVRARFMAACRGVEDIVFGVDMNRPEYIAAGLRALALCAAGPASSETR